MSKIYKEIIKKMEIDMEMLLVNITFLLNTLGIVFALVLLQLGMGNKKLYTCAGWLLLVVGLIGWLCTLYYMYHYQIMVDITHSTPGL
jgi:hypothetical protein